MGSFVTMDTMNYVGGAKIIKIPANLYYGCFRHFQYERYRVKEEA